MKELTLLEEGVYAYNGNIAKIGDEEILFIESDASINKNKRSRICTHTNSADLIHEMLIAITKESYIKPHKHTNKTESFHMIKGTMFVIIFDNHGTPISSIPLSSEQRGYYFYYRIPKNIYHTIALMSDTVVFHETTNGPFKPKDTLYLNISNSLKSKEEINLYKDRLLKFALTNSEITRKSQ